MSNSASPPLSLRNTAVQGTLWGALGAGVGKIAAFGAQIYLGWILSKEDFAVYAMALACSMFVAGLVNGGTQRVLVQRGTEYDRYAFLVLKISALFNVLVLMLLLAAAIPAGRQTDAPELTTLLFVMGLATLLSTPGHVLTAKLLIDLRFKHVQLLAMASHFMRHGTTVVFAALGFGALSFVLPMVVVAVVDTGLAYLAVRRMPPARAVVWADAKDILGASKWVMLGTAAGALIQNGDNLAVALFAEPATLGVYFFGYQLTFSLAGLLGGSLLSVLVPTFVRMGTERVRQRRAFVTALHVMTVGTACLAFGLVIVVEPLIHALWAGKWDEAAVVAQWLALSLPAVLAASMARALAEARGAWALTTQLAVAEGVGTILAAALGVLSGGLTGIAVSVSLFKVLAGCVQLVVVLRSVEPSAWEGVLPLFSAYGVGVTALAVAQLCGNAVTEAGFAVPFSMVVSAGGFVVIYAALASMFCKRGTHELLKLFRNLRRSTRGADAHAQPPVA